jgi:hypothetical protein
MNGAELLAKSENKVLEYMQKKIGILEISEPTHYSAVNGLMKSYAWDKNNTVYVFTIEKIATALNENGLPDNARLIVYSEEDDLRVFFKKIETYEFERFHLCTVSKHYAEVLEFTPKCKELYFHIHNVETWFDDKFSLRLRVLIDDLKNPALKIPAVKKVGRFLKEIVFTNYRQKILRKVYSYNHHFIVHSAGVKQFLSKFVPAHKITVFPFAIYEHMQDNSLNNTKLRICVPGIVTNARRDYDSLFRVLLANAERLKGRLTIDLLGFIPKEELHLVETIKKLQSSGIDMLYYLEFVFGEKYDRPLSHADLILGNLRVERNSAQKYGQTKESGTVYNMVRGAKPGLLPDNYPLDEEFYPSSLLFKDYDHLGEMIVQLVDNGAEISRLKQQAKINSEQFSPMPLNELLMSEKVSV